MDLPEDEGPSQEWLASYADAMTLLLTFFIVMYAFALVDLAKFADLKVGVSAAFGHANPVTDNTESVLADGTGLLPEIGSLAVKPTEAEAAESQAARDGLATDGVVTAENAEALRDLLRQKFAEVGAADYVEVGIDDRGVFVRFDGRVLFPSDEADINPDGLAVLATAADVLEVVDNTLEIEGHTDSVPAGGDWISNWELSSARAASVVRWMIDYGRIPSTRMVAVGLADTHPRADNTTEEGRTQNRRVEIAVRVPGITTGASQTLDLGDQGDGAGSEDPVPAGAGTPSGAAPGEAAPGGRAERADTTTPIAPVSSADG